MKTFGAWRTWDEAANHLVDRGLSPDSIEILTAAYALAEERHQGQTRPAGEPYVSHLLQVVEILATELEVSDPALLAAGLLHDSVEDTDCTPDDIRAALPGEIGERVVELVGWVTIPEVLTGQTKATVRQEYLEHLRGAPVEVLRLKLADRYSNVQRLHTHPRVAKQRSYYAETAEHFVPLAKVDDRCDELFSTWVDAYDYLTGKVDNVVAAEKLAAAAHREQVDKAGAPYIEHPRAVARNAERLGASEDQRMAALLHDVVEDTSCTLEQLHDLGVPASVVDLVDALTSRPGESHEAYLARLVETPEAILVKRADIEHNQSPERLAQLDPPTQDRLRCKYEMALTMLEHTGPGQC